MFSCRPSPFCMIVCIVNYCFGCGIAEKQLKQLRNSPRGCFVQNRSRCSCWHKTMRSWCCVFFITILPAICGSRVSQNLKAVYAFTGVLWGLLQSAWQKTFSTMLMSCIPICDLTCCFCWQTVWRKNQAHEKNKLIKSSVLAILGALGEVCCCSSLKKVLKWICLLN